MTHLKPTLALTVFVMIFGRAHSAITYTMPSTCDATYTGFDIPGIPVARAGITGVTSANQCAFMCSKFNGCECWLWDRAAGPLCYLRNACAYNHKISNNNFVSGKCAQPTFTFPATCQKQYVSRLWIAPTIPLSHEISSVDTIEECATICSTFNGCGCYSYYGAPGRGPPKCFLYRNCVKTGLEIHVISGTCTQRTMTLPSVSVTPRPTPKPTTSQPTPKPTTLKPTLKPTPIPTVTDLGSFVKADSAADTWAKARQACTNEGDDLAIILDLSQNGGAVAACAGNSPGCWIGLKSDASGKFAWMNGRALTYQRFASGEPSIQANACVYIDATSGQWKTAACGTSLTAICQVPRAAFAEAVGETATESTLKGWLIAMVCGVVLCCVLVAVPCVVLGRIKEGETKPLLSKS